MSTGDAISAVERVAHRLGLGPVAPVMLSLARRHVVRLAPLPLVARVGHAADVRAVIELTRELAVARQLARCGAPAVRPADGVDPGPHPADGWALTLWVYLPHRAAEDDDALAAGKALRRVHAALAGFDGALPPFADLVASCGQLLAAPERTPRLADRDRAFLSGLHVELTRAMAGHSWRPTPIHGDAHLGNVLIAADGARWSDFEAACLGPREWDIACLPETARPACGDHDAALVRLLADLRRVCVAAWCWADYGRHARVDEAARHHLQALRERHGTG